MARKHRATITTPHGLRVGFQATAERPGRKPLVTRFGGIPLKRQKKAAITDRLPPRPPAARADQRLRTRRCECCDTLTDVETHQVRKLADLARTGRPQPWWAQLMAQMRRKTLVVCASCHQAIHHGSITAPVTA